MKFVIIVAIIIIIINIIQNDLDGMGGAKRKTPE